MALISGVQVNDNTYGLRAEAIPTGSITSDTNGVLTATVPKITQLTPGIICIINNSFTLSQSIISLNVNSFGAKPIYDSMTNSTIRDFILKSNETFLFSYNETLLSTGCWILHHGPSHCADLVDYSPYDPYEDSALIFTLELNGTSVSLNRNFLSIQVAFYSNLKTFFVLFPTQYTGIVFEVSYVDVTNQTIHLSSQQQNSRYYIVLTPVTSATMGGTLYTINTPSSNPEIGNGYTTCDTAKTTLTKTADLTNYVLDKGYVSIKFTYDVPANSTLNINNTGAKSIYYRGAAITDDIICANDIALFCYDGTKYNLISIDKSCEGAIATLDANGVLTIENITYIQNGDTIPY